MLFKQKYWHDLFEAGVFLKALNALWEGATGLGLLLVTHTRTFHRALDTTQRRLIGGHGDRVFDFAAQQFHHLSVSTRNFVGIYLLVHALLNLFLAYNLYKNRMWAYPLAAAVVSVFSIYQIYRIFHTHSLILTGVTALDIAFVVLTVHEYRYQRHTRH